MQINYHGLGCFVVKGKKASIVMDPFDPNKTGVSLRKIKGDIITLSQENGYLSAEKVGPNGGEGELITVNWPGEYEYSDISIIGIPTWQNKKEQEGGEAHNTVFTYVIDDMAVCHLGMLGHTLSTEQYDELGEVDVLMVPVGGIGSFDVDKAEETIDKIGPRLVIPMYYSVAGEKMNLGKLDAFLKKFGDTVEKTETLKINKRDLPAKEETKVIVVEQKSKE